MHNKFKDEPQTIARVLDKKLTYESAAPNNIFTIREELSCGVEIPYYKTNKIVTHTH